LRSRDQSPVNRPPAGADHVGMESRGWYPSRRIVPALIGLVLLVGVGSVYPLTEVSAGPLSAKNTGSCSGSADWRITVLRESRKLAVKLTITGAPPKSSWTIFMDDNGSGFYAGSRTANRKGRVRAEDLTPDRPGPDRIVAAASDRASGEICTGRVTI